MHIPHLYADGFSFWLDSAEDMQSFIANENCLLFALVAPTLATIITMEQLCKKMPIVSVLSISALHQRSFDIPHMIANTGINNSLRPERLMLLIRISNNNNKMPVLESKKKILLIPFCSSFRLESYYSTVLLLHLCTFKSINGQFFLFSSFL